MKPSAPAKTEPAAGTHRCRQLGRTGNWIYPIGLGAMQLSMSDSPGDEGAIAVIHAALEAGMTFIDTANVYCMSDDDIGHNERLIEKALRLFGAPKTIVVATKGGVDRRRRIIDASPSFLRASCIESLRALNREAVTLYQLHSPDENVPLEESIGELSRLKEEGKIIHVGVCNVTLEELRRAHRLERIETVQNRCNPIDAEDYHDGFLEFCEEHGVSYLPHGVLGGKAGFQSMAAQPIFVDLAVKCATSPHAVIVAWHLAKSRRVIPIPGASRLDSVRSSAGAVDLTLSAIDVRRIDSLCPIS